MKQLFAGFLSILCVSALAQPDLDRYQFYRLGDSAKYTGVQAAAFEPGPAGMGVLWDFSRLQPHSKSNFNLRIMAVRDSPCPEVYPDADLVYFKGTRFGSEFRYLQTRGNRIYQVGIDTYNAFAHKGSPLGRRISRDTSFLPRLNISFGKTQTDGINGTTATPSSPGSTLISRNDLDGETTITYDGYGTIKLPDRREIDGIMRVKIERDWIERTAAFPTDRQFQETEYHYYEPGHSAPIFIYTKKVTISIDSSSQKQPTFTVKKAAYRYEKESLSETPANWGAHLAADTGLFGSHVLIHNPTDQTQTLHLQGVDAEGALLQSLDVDIESGSTARYATAATFGRDATSFFARDCQSCLVSTDYRALLPGGSSAQVFQPGDLRRSLEFYPGDWDQLFEGQAIVNASDRPIKITATQLDFNGEVLGTVVLEDKLRPAAKHLSLLNELFPEQPNSIIRIQSDGVMSMVGLRFSKDQQHLFQNQPLPLGIDPYRGRWIPHLTDPDGGFLTEILVTNRDSKKRRLVFIPYGADGTPFPPVGMALEAFQTKRFAKGDLFPENATHAEITGDHICLVSLVFRADITDGSAAVVHEVTTENTDFSFYPGTWSHVHDGLAIVNTSDQPAAIRLQQIDDAGTVLNDVVLLEDLAPHAKYLGLLDQVLPEKDDTLMRITSDQPIAILSLRLSKDRRVLYSNGGIRP